MENPHYILIYHGTSNIIGFTTSMTLASRLLTLKTKLLQKLLSFLTHLNVGSLLSHLIKDLSIIAKCGLCHL